MVDVAASVMLLATLYVMTMGLHVAFRAWFGQVGSFEIWYACSIAATLAYLRYRRRSV